MLTWVVVVPFALIVTWKMISTKRSGPVGLMKCSVITLVTVKTGSLLVLPPLTVPVARYTSPVVRLVPTYRKVSRDWTWVPPVSSTVTTLTTWLTPVTCSSPKQSPNMIVSTGNVSLVMVVVALAAAGAENAVTSASRRMVMIETLRITHLQVRSQTVSRSGLHLPSDRFNGRSRAEGWALPALHGALLSCQPQYWPV